VLDPARTVYRPSRKTFCNIKHFLFLKYCATDLNDESFLQFHPIWQYKHNVKREPNEGMTTAVPFLYTPAKTEEVSA
jgi:hypothetical protein